MSHHKKRKNHSSHSTQHIYKQIGISAHATPFIENDKKFSPKSVGDGIHTYDSAEDITVSYLKGMAIAMANKGHKTGCPFGIGKFLPEGATHYAFYLHLGTTRIWNADSTINKARWHKLLKYVESVQGTDEIHIIRESTLKRYLNHCAAEDPEEKNTGRQAPSGILGFFSRQFQYYMARAAWDETFKLLSNGRIPLIDNLSKNEPYIETKRLRLFFENTKQALEEAKAQHGVSLKPC